MEIRDERGERDKRRVDDEAALAGLNIARLNLSAAAQGHQTEDVAGLKARESRRGLGKGGGERRGRT